jgi:hypothetical protein
MASNDQFAKPGILPRFANKRARQSRATFVATSTCVLVAAALPCAGAVLQTARIAPGLPVHMPARAQRNRFACAPIS